MDSRGVSRSGSVNSLPQGEAPVPAPRKIEAWTELKSPSNLTILKNLFNQSEVQRRQYELTSLSDNLGDLENRLRDYLQKVDGEIAETKQKQSGTSGEVKSGYDAKIAYLSEESKSLRGRLTEAAKLRKQVDQQTGKVKKQQVKLSQEVYEAGIPRPGLFLRLKLWAHSVVRGPLEDRVVRQYNTMYIEVDSSKGKTRTISRVLQDTITKIAQVAGLGAGQVGVLDQRIAHAQKLAEQQQQLTDLAKRAGELPKDGTLPRDVLLAEIAKIQAGAAEGLRTTTNVSSKDASEGLAMMQELQEREAEIDAHVKALAIIVDGFQGQHGSRLQLDGTLAAVRRLPTVSAQGENAVLALTQRIDFVGKAVQHAQKLVDKIEKEGGQRSPLARAVVLREAQRRVDQLKDLQKQLYVSLKDVASGSADIGSVIAKAEEADTTLKQVLQVIEDIGTHLSALLGPKVSMSQRNESVDPEQFTAVSRSLSDRLTQAARAANSIDTVLSPADTMRHLTGDRKSATTAFSNRQAVAGLLEEVRAQALADAPKLMNSPAAEDLNSIVSGRFLSKALELAESVEYADSSFLLQVAQERQMIEDFSKVQASLPADALPDDVMQKLEIAAKAIVLSRSKMKEAESRKSAMVDKQAEVAAVAADLRENYEALEQPNMEPELKGEMLELQAHLKSSKAVLDAELRLLTLQYDTPLMTGKMLERDYRTGLAELTGGAPSGIDTLARRAAHVEQVSQGYDLGSINLKYLTMPHDASPVVEFSRALVEMVSSESVDVEHMLTAANELSRTEVRKVFGRNNQEGAQLFRDDVVAYATAQQAFAFLAESKLAEMESVLAADEAPSDAELAQVIDSLFSSEEYRALSDLRERMFFYAAVIEIAGDRLDKKQNDPALLALKERVAEAFGKCDGAKEFFSSVMIRPVQRAPRIILFMNQFIDLAPVGTLADTIATHSAQIRTRLDAANADGAALQVRETEILDRLFAADRRPGMVEIIKKNAKDHPERLAETSFLVGKALFKGLDMLERVALRAYIAREIAMAKVSETAPRRLSKPLPAVPSGAKTTDPAHHILRGAIYNTLGNTGISWLAANSGGQLYQNLRARVDKILRDNDLIGEDGRFAKMSPSERAKYLVSKEFEDLQEPIKAEVERAMAKAKEQSPE